jgi:hypothetical protein
VLSAAARGGEITSEWVGNSGDWADVTQWSTNPNYPNNETPAGTEYDALIDAPGSGPYTVSLENNVTTDSVTLNSPNATLLQTGGTLTTGAVNISAGTYNLSGGALQATSYNNTGGTLAVGGTILPLTVAGTQSFNNAGGTIVADAGSIVRLVLGPGVATTSQLGNLVTNGGGIFLEAVNVSGTLNNTGSTLTATGTSGAAHIWFITVENGAINLPAGSTVGRYATLADVSLESDLKVGFDDSASVQDINGLGHTINVVGSSLFIKPDPNQSTATLSNVNVNLSSDASVHSEHPVLLDGATTLEGETGSGDASVGVTGPEITNQGLIDANVNGQTLQVGPQTLVNRGTLQAVGGATLGIGPQSAAPPGWINNGLLSVDSASQIAVNQATQFASGSAFDVMLGSNGNCGILTLGGTLSIQSDVSLDISLAPGAAFSGPYEIISYPGYSLNGTFAQVTPGFTVDYSRPGEILVTSIPEPVGFGFLAASGGLLLARRRARRR